MPYGYIPEYLYVYNLKADTTDLGTVVISDVSTTGDVTVGGNLDLASSSIVNKGGNRFIHNYEDPTTAGLNTFLGELAGNTTLASGGSSFQASRNVGVGANALVSLTTGYNNVAIGNNSMQFCQSGAENMALGYLALQDVTTGGSNVALGSGSARNLTTGGANVAVGRNSLLNLSTTDNNTVIGHFSGENTTGASNTFLGYQAGRLLTTGSNNIMIGALTNTSTVTESNKLNIGNLVVGDISAGLLGVNCTDAEQPVSTLEVCGSLGKKVTTVSAASANIAADDNVISVTRTATGACSLTLPLAADAWNATDSVGREYLILDSAANAATFNITVNRNTTDTIVTTATGATSVVVNTDGGSVRLIAINSTTWKAI